MPNRAAHAVGAVVVVGGLMAREELSNGGEITWKTLASGVLASELGSLPDLLEPATNPRHRQFFHGLAFATALGIGLHKLYEWEAETDLDRFFRALGLIVGGAYTTHLAMDFVFSRSGLPLVGKL